MRTLDSVSVGEKVLVLKVLGEKPIKKRLMDMGITKGTEIEVVKIAPLGDPIEFKIRGYDLSLRKHDAANIEVE